MPYGGDFSARSPGEMRTFSFDAANDLSALDYIVGVSATLTVFAGVDANASALLIGAPSIGPTKNRQRVAAVLKGAAAATLNTIVSQQIGANALAPAGFMAEVVYSWTITATTALGDGPVIWTMRIPVAGF